VKTGLFSMTCLGEFLSFDHEPLVLEGAELKELRWIEEPSQLGMAPGETGFSSWLSEAVPRLRGEVDNPNVAFGVSTAGDVEHSSGLLHDWWSGGGHPRQWTDGRPSPLVADLMGLPVARTFVIHDGSAHLLGCSRCAVPPPGLACLALGTGVGFGLSDEQGAAVDASTPHGGRSHLINGAPLSGAPYLGVWRQWLQLPGGSSKKTNEVMAREFAGSSKPWRTPWVSLVLGRRGMELAEAVHGCPEPGEVDCCNPEQHDAMVGGDPRELAVKAYGQQWLHFLHTQFLPHFTSGKRRHRVERLCFSGGIAEVNGPALRQVLLEDGADALRSLSPVAATSVVGAASERPKRGKASSRTGAPPTDCDSAHVKVLPMAPCGTALIGAGIYAVAGMGGACMGIWAS